MAIDKIPFREPNPEEQTTIFRYDKGRRLDLITKKYQSSNHIKMYSRIAGKQMINIITGEVKDYKPKEKQAYSQVVSKMKAINRLLLDNFDGADSEILIILWWDVENTDIQEEKPTIKNFLERLQRRLPPIMFVKVLLYKEKAKPEYHFWIKTIDGEKLDKVQIQSIVTALWVDRIKRAEIRRITKDNRYDLASYFSNRNYDKNVYPVSARICSFSRGKKLNIGIAETVDRNTATEQTKGYERTYAVCKSQTEYINRN